MVMIMVGSVCVPLVHVERLHVDEIGSTFWTVGPSGYFVWRLTLCKDLDRNKWAAIPGLDCSQLIESSIGNAKTAGLQADLKLSSSDYSLAVSIFFIGESTIGWGHLT